MRYPALFQEVPWFLDFIQLLDADVAENGEIQQRRMIRTTTVPAWNPLKILPFAFF